MPYSLSDLVDIPAMQRMMENLWKAAGLPVGILDVDGKVLIAAGWKEICTSSHRKHPRTEPLCRQSDAFIQDHFCGRRAMPDCGYIEYRCQNGLIDIAVPIAVEGRQLATLFLGQFFYEPPDRHFFIEQAGEYGFDESSYLKALAEAPIFTRQKVEEILAFHTQLVGMLSSMGLERLRHLEAREEREYREAFGSLIAGISSRFVKLPPSEVDGGIDLALRELGEFAGVDRCYVCQFSSDSLRVDYTHEWCAPGIESLRHRRREFDAEQQPWAMAKIKSKQVVHAPRVAELPVEAIAEKTWWQSLGIRSLLGVPIFSAGELFGVLAFETVGSKEIGEENDLTLLKTVGTIIGNAIERQRSEVRLKESEERLALALRVSDEGVWDWDLKTGHIFLSPRYYTMLGYEPGEFPPSLDSWEKLLHPEDRHRAVAAAEEHRLTGGKGEAEFRLRAMNGEYLHILSKGQVVARDGEGNPTRMVGIHMNITERKEAELELQAAHRRLEEIIEFLPDATFVIDSDKKVVAWNRAIEEMTGVPKEEILGHADYAYALPFWGERRPVLVDLLGRPVSESGSLYDAIERSGDGLRAEEFAPALYGGRGAYIWGTASPLYDLEGNRVGAIESIRDITERKEAEERLRESEERHRQLFVGNKAVELQIDPVDGSIVDANRAASLYYGYSVPELKAMNISDINCLSEEEVGREMQRAADEQRDHFLFRHRLASGDVRDVEVRSGPIIMKERALLYSIIHDITERKEAEEALRRSEMKFRRLSREFQALLDGIPDSLSLLSPDLEVVWVNKAAADYSGLTADSHVGKICHSLWRDRSEPCDDCPVVRAFASGEVEESIVAAADGSRWELKALPLKDKEGKVVNVIELGTDITEKSRLRLEAERAGRLASLGELAAGVAHEINNPNALIRINSSILAKALPDVLPILEAHYRERGDFRVGALDYSDLREELPDLFSEMRDASDRIKRIVEDMKDFTSPVGYGRTEAVDLNAAVEAALRLCGHSIRKWTNNFAVVHGEALPSVSGDFQGVVQVVVNLVVNACLALPEKGRGVLVSTFFEKERNRVVLRVRDEGVGIAEKDMPHITDPFFTTRREDGGTGLGLSICARIVKEMGASLSFDSSPGEGTTATLSMLPLQEELSR